MTRDQLANIIGFIVSAVLVIFVEIMAFVWVMQDRVAGYLIMDFNVIFIISFVIGSCIELIKKELRD